MPDNNLDKEKLKISGYAKFSKEQIVSEIIEVPVFINVKNESIELLADVNEKLKKSGSAIILGKSGTGKTTLITKYILQKKINVEYPGNIYWLDFTHITEPNSNLIADLMGNVFNIRCDTFDIAKQELDKFYKSSFQKKLIIFENVMRPELLNELLPTEIHNFIIISQNVNTSEWHNLKIKKIDSRIIKTTNFTQNNTVSFFEELEKQNNSNITDSYLITEEQAKLIHTKLNGWPILLKLFYTYSKNKSESQLHDKDKIVQNLLSKLMYQKAQYISNTDNLISIVLDAFYEKIKSTCEQNYEIIFKHLLSYITYGYGGCFNESLLVIKGISEDSYEILCAYGLTEKSECYESYISVHHIIKERLRSVIKGKKDKNISEKILLEYLINDLYFKLRDLFNGTLDKKVTFDYAQEFTFSPHAKIQEIEKVICHVEELIVLSDKKKISIIYLDNTSKKNWYKVLWYTSYIYHQKGMYEAAKRVIEKPYKELVENEHLYCFVSLETGYFYALYGMIIFHLNETENAKEVFTKGAGKTGSLLYKYLQSETYNQERNFLVGIFESLLATVYTRKYKENLKSSEDSSYLSVTQRSNNSELAKTQFENALKSKNDYFKELNKKQGVEKYNFLVHRAKVEIAVTQMFFGEYYLAQNKYKESYECLIEAKTNLYEQYKGVAYHFNLANINLLLGELYRLVGSFDKADACFEKSCQSYKSYNNNHHKLLVRSEILRAKNNFYRQRLNPAQQKIEEMLKDQANFISYDADELELKIYHARTFIKQGKHNEAEKKLIESYKFLEEIAFNKKIEICQYPTEICPYVSYKRIYSPYSPRILHYLGLNNYKQGKYKLAEDLFFEAIKLKLWLSGSKDFDNLSYEYDSSNENLISKALRSFNENKDAKALLSLHELANIFFHKGQYKKAEKLFEEILHIQKNVYQEIYVKLNKKIDCIQEIQITKHCLARIYMSQGEYKQAEKNIFDIDTYKESANLDKSSNYYTKAKFSYLKGDLNKAKGDITQAIESFNILCNEEDQTKEHLNYIRLIRLKAVILLNCNEYKEAEELLKECLSKIIKLFPQKHPETLLIYWNLGDLYIAQDVDDKSAQDVYDKSHYYYGCADDLLETIHPLTKEPIKHPDHLQLKIRCAWYYHCLGENLFATSKDKGEGLDHLIKSKDMYEESIGVAGLSKYDKLSVSLALSKIYALLGQYFNDENYTFEAKNKLNIFSDEIKKENIISWHPAWIYILTRHKYSDKINLGQSFAQRYMDLLFSIINQKKIKIDKRNKNNLIFHYLKLAHKHGILIDKNIKNYKSIFGKNLEKITFDKSEDNTLNIALDINNEILIEWYQNCKPRTVVNGLNKYSFSEIKEEQAEFCLVLSHAYFLLGQFQLAVYLNNKCVAFKTNNEFIKQYSDFLTYINRYAINREKVNESLEELSVDLSTKTKNNTSNEKIQFLFACTQLELAKIYWHQNKNEKSKNLYDKAIEIFGKEYTAWNKYSSIDFESYYQNINDISQDDKEENQYSNFIKAKLEYRKIKKDNDFSKIDNKLFDNAVDSLKLLYGEYSMQPDLADAYDLQGRYYLFLGDYEKAKEIFNKALCIRYKRYRTGHNRNKDLLDVKETERWFLICLLFMHKYDELMEYCDSILLRLDPKKYNNEIYWNQIRLYKILANNLHGNYEHIQQDFSKLEKEMESLWNESQDDNKSEYLRLFFYFTYKCDLLAQGDCISQTKLNLPSIEDLINPLIEISPRYRIYEALWYLIEARTLEKNKEYKSAANAFIKSLDSIKVLYENCNYEHPKVGEILFYILNFLKYNSIFHNFDNAFEALKNYFEKNNMDYWLYLVKKNNNFLAKTTLIGENISLKIVFEQVYSFLENFNEQNLAVSENASSLKMNESTFDILHIQGVKMPSFSMETLQETLKRNNKAEDLFKGLAIKKCSWSEIKKLCLLKEDLSNAGKFDAKEIVEKLIRKREELDELYYRKSISNLFPEESYGISQESTGDLKDDGTEFKLIYYKFNIYNSPISSLRGENKNLPHAKILVKAPGSRDLTSDIDTTIEVTDIEKIKLDDAIFPEDWINKKDDHDHSLLVQASIIYYFNKLNEDNIGMSSGESRDSNVYSDGFTHADGYPKFKEFDIDFDQELKNIYKNWKESFNPYKAKKQQQELAASLFSLREYYSVAEINEEWDSFKESLITEWDNIDNEAISKEAFIENINSVFILVAEYFSYKKGQLDLVLKEDTYDRDKEVIALNKIYADHIVKLAKIRHEITEFNLKIKDNLEELKKNSDSILLSGKACQFLAGGCENGIISELYEQQLLLLKSKKIEATTIRKKLTENIERLSQLINEQQEAQIKANLFANEAYVNRSAPYHVVQWIQSQNNVSINRKQVIMGSILQQIGFRLLHGELLKKQGKPTEEILYNISKYGLRVADMIFGTEKYFGDKIFEEMELSNLKGILFRLGETKPESPNFTQNQLKLVNLDTRIVKRIKKDSSIEVHKKSLETKWMLQDYMYRRNKPKVKDVSEHDRKSISEKDLKNLNNINEWINIAKNIIVITYKSKFSKNGKFWGNTDSEKRVQIK